MSDTMLPLLGASLIRESDKALYILCRIRYLDKNGNHDRDAVAWFPKSKVTVDDGRYSVERWLIEAKETELAEKLECDTMEIRIAG